MNATIFAFSVATPFAMAITKRFKWSKRTNVAVSALIALLAYVIGQFFDSQLAWPLPTTFWPGYAAAYGVSQATYQVLDKFAPSVLGGIEKATNY